MRSLRYDVLPVVVAAVWISVSEFVRNELLFKFYWIDHYAAMGLEFPSELINGAIWGVWSLVFAIVALVISRKFGLLATTAILWTAGFIMMWLVVGNLGVLPFSLLWFAVPLSVLEAFLAAFIVSRLGRKPNGI